MRELVPGRFARHVSVPGFGARGQAAIEAGAARFEAAISDREAAAVAATFLVAGGTGSVTPPGIAAPAHATPVTLPGLPAWWPGAPGDATALACFRGAVAATRWMLGTAAAEAIPDAVLAAACAHARAAYPRECCGYLTGARDAALDAAIACTNLAGDADRYEIGGGELVALVRSFDSAAPARVIYHSHPNGRAYLSERDRTVAATPAGPVYPVTHLVIGVDGGGVREAAQFAWDGTDYVEVARYLTFSGAC